MTGMAEGRTGSVHVEVGDPDWCWNPVRHMDHRHVNRDNPNRSYWCDGDGEWARHAFAKWRVEDGILLSDDVDEWLRARGLPEGAGLPNLILHERANAALATAFRMLAREPDGGEAQ